MDQHLTVREACKFAGKSESTIKRLIREITGAKNHPDRSLILPPPEEVERRRKAGDTFVWKLNQELLLRRFPVNSESATNSSTRKQGAGESDGIIQVLREQLQSKDRQLQTLETQLDRKDDQIKSLNERMHESNILMRELQGKLAIASPARSPSPSAVDAKSEEGTVVAPDAVRIMLTGNQDQHTAASAVNTGKVFQFLNKPCPPEALAQAISEAVIQYQLAKGEKELLAKTLTGSVGLLTEVLALSNPTAFGKSSRVRHLVARISEQMHLENAWEVTVAAMLCQVGCVSISERTLAKLSSGISLSAKEEEAIANHAAAGHRLICKIPRLDGVAEIVGRQNEEYDPLRDCPAGHEAQWLGADILKAALEFDELTTAGAKADLALRSMADHAGIYNPRVLAAFMEVFSVTFASITVEATELKEGMILEEHLTNAFGEILVVQGHEITAGLRERLRSMVTKSIAINPVRVLCPWLQTSPQVPTEVF